MAAPALIKRIAPHVPYLGNLIRPKVRQRRYRRVVVPRLIWNRYLWEIHRERLLSMMPLCEKNPGASLWIRRV